jgi:hypothetical protein
MEQASYEANNHSASQDILSLLWNLKVLLMCGEVPEVISSLYVSE